VHEEKLENGQNHNLQKHSEILASKNDPSKFIPGGGEVPAQQLVFPLREKSNQ